MFITDTDDIRRTVLSTRKARGLTQSQVAGLCGFSTKWLSDFENGKNNPPIELVIRLMNAYGISMEVRTPERRVEADVNYEIDSERGLDF